MEPGLSVCVRAQKLCSCHSTVLENSDSWVCSVPEQVREWLGILKQSNNRQKRKAQLEKTLQIHEASLLWGSNFALNLSF